ncbi:MAG TPA: hypothetical protein VE553_07545 [Candidatus Binatia bacterium]|nr:hypothetical protein [Candidatus Binatia bacterium]
MDSPSHLPDHSFVVKIWLEEAEDEAHRAVWRGHITHVRSGKRVYFQDLGAMISFLVPYLGEMGVRMGLRWRLRQRLRF